VFLIDIAAFFSDFRLLRMSLRSASLPPAARRLTVSAVPSR
jgi:hypothetical protein